MTLSIKGKVSIFKIDSESKTKIYEDNNIITKGMGYTLANLMSEQEDTKLENFQIRYFQIGTGKVDFSLEDAAVQSYFYELQSPLTYAAYGDNIDSEIKKNYSLVDTAFTTGLNLIKGSQQSFVEIPESRTTKFFTRSAKFRLFVEKNMANNNEILELGLFAKNPDSTYKQDNPVLVAYKAITSSITKNQDNQFLIEWSISVLDESEI
jgi:hypothetical protein